MAENEALVDVERLWLDETSWVDVARGWLPDADAVYDEVVAAAPWHQSRIFRYERWLDDTVIAVLTLGARRPWLLRPRSNRYSSDETGGATHDLAPGSGDLLVMGGRCQADWEHAVPKLSRPVRGRVSLQWRWTSRTGRPERGPNYRAPRTFSR